jgi:ribosomal protein L44E
VGFGKSNDKDILGHICVSSLRDGANTAAQSSIATQCQHGFVRRHQRGGNKGTVEERKAMPCKIETWEFECKDCKSKQRQEIRVSSAARWYCPPPPDGWTVVDGNYYCGDDHCINERNWLKKRLDEISDQL